MIHDQVDLVIRAEPGRQQLTNLQLRSGAVEERPCILLRRMRDRLGERALLRGQLPVPLLIVGLGELRVQRSERDVYKRQISLAAGDCPAPEFLAYFRD